MSYRVLENCAGEYDAWHDSEEGKATLTMEVKCVQPLQCACPRPYLEVGVGSERFVQAPGTEYGVPGIQLLSSSIRVVPFFY